MPSIRKRMTGFIRQLSAPPTTNGMCSSQRGAGQHTVTPPETPSSQSECFIQKYLNGESHTPGPEIYSGKSGHELPSVGIGPIDPEVFAAFTGPEGGITSISTATDRLGSMREADDSEDFDYIDLEEGLSRRPSDSGIATGIAARSELEPRSYSMGSFGATRKGQVNNSVMNIRVMGNIYKVDSNGGGPSTSDIVDVDEALSCDEKPNAPRSRLASVEQDYPELGSDFTVSTERIGPASTVTINRSYNIVRRLKLDLRNETEVPIAGIRNWYRPNCAATGQAVTLYERHPQTAEHAGNPIADTFAVVARKNSALLVLGDGVNWGARAALASRCAVYGCMDFLNQAIFADPKPHLTTQDVFQCLLQSFHAAHSLILQEEAQLTTLTACLVLPVKKEENGDEDEFVACVCNVGDSLAYVFNPENGHVREITQGSHDIQSNRDMRDALGALGPVDGVNPELSNLTCSLTKVQAGDIVFLTSDGISDNFDPVVGKFCVPKRPERQGGRQQAKRQESEPSLPSVAAYQRHELTLLRMEDILNYGSGSEAAALQPSLTSFAPPGRVKTAAELCHRMVDFCQRLTTAKRKILEDPELYPESSVYNGPDSEATRTDQKMRRRKVCEKLAVVPGKLDHATLTAYCVGDRQKSLQHYSGDRTEASVPLTKLRAPCASSEDLTFRDEEDMDDNEATPTASVSLGSSPSEGCSSLAVTPVHLPRPGQES